MIEKDTALSLIRAAKGTAAQLFKQEARRITQEELEQASERAHKRLNDLVKRLTEEMEFAARHNVDGSVSLSVTLKTPQG